MPNKRVLLPWTTVLSDDTTETFWPGTPWMSTQGILQARAQVEIRGIGSNMRVTPAYQLADIADTPTAEGAGIEPGQLDTNGYHYPTDYTTTAGAAQDTDDKRLIRFGWRVSLSTTANGLTKARVGGMIQVVLE